MSALLIARKTFGDDDDNTDKKVCPAEDTSGPPIQPIFGSTDFHTFSTILAGACGIASCLLTILIIARHATNYKSPVQQRQIIRILLLVPWVSIFSFLTVWQSHAGEYLVEALDFGCSISLSSFLLLLCDYVLSNDGGFDALFDEGAWKRGQFSNQSPKWLKYIWYQNLQFIPTSIIIWLATVISLAAGTYCGTSNSPHFAHIWISVFKTIVTTLAILAVFRFHKRMKSQLAPHKVFLKFFAFKGIIGLNVLQTFLINILIGQHVLKPTSHLSYFDIKVAMPALLMGCEMPLFALLLLFAFPVTPYRISQKPNAAGPAKAVFDAFNVTDLFSAFIRGPMRLVREQLKGMARQESMPLVVNYGGGVDAPPAYETEYRGHGRRGPEGV